ncbi:MAG: hypothetical protein GXP63_05725 [DPANN group archaeon]|nr:hypothetical protein [DPANN group archaeon]
MFKVVPLSSGFFLTSIVGFFVSLYAIYPESKTWGFTLMLFFIFMFIAAMISMSTAQVDDILMQEAQERHDDQMRRARKSRR